MGFATKAEWAEAKADEIERQIKRISKPYIPMAKWQKVRNRERTLDHLRREKLRFERLAARFREAR